MTTTNTRILSSKEAATEAASRLGPDWHSELVPVVGGLPDTMRWEVRRNEPCECGRPGVHPYPIGGGWALACDECRQQSIEDFYITGSDDAETMTDSGASVDTWSRWQREAGAR